MREVIASFHVSFENAANAYLYDDTLKESLRSLSAQVLQMKALYLGLEFDKVKGAYGGSSALDKVERTAPRRPNPTAVTVSTRIRRPAPS